jgi:hypothetical protein
MFVASLYDLVSWFKLPTRFEQVRRLPNSGIDRFPRKWPKTQKVADFPKTGRIPRIGSFWGSRKRSFPDPVLGVCFRDIRNHNFSRKMQLGVPDYRWNPPEFVVFSTPPAPCFRACLVPPKRGTKPGVGPVAQSGSRNCQFCHFWQFWLFLVFSQISDVFLKSWLVWQFQDDRTAMPTQLASLWHDLTSRWALDSDWRVQRGSEMSSWLSQFPDQIFIKNNFVAKVFRTECRINFVQLHYF